MRRLLGLVVALLLLAGGVALGAGPLQGDTSERDRELAAEKAEVAARGTQVTALQDAARKSNAYDAATASAVVRGRLDGRSVALVTLPGADPSTVTALRSLIGTAGGRVSAQIGLADALVSSGGRPLVDALTSQMATPLTRGKRPVPVPSTGSGYTRFGALLARAIGVPAAARKPQASYDVTSIGIIAGFRTAKLVSARSVSARSALTVVVGGPADQATQEAALAVVSAYARQVPTIVLGPGDGLVAALRAGPAKSLRLTTVDGAGAPAGRVGAVLALAARTRGVVGAYGSVGGTDAPIPPLQ